MTSNGLDFTKMRLILADGDEKVIEMEARLQAIIGKLVAIGPEIEDPHTCQCVLHLGRRGDVKVDLQKRY